MYFNLKLEYPLNIVHVHITALYTGTRYNDKFHYNDNLTGTKPQGVTVNLIAFKNIIYNTSLSDSNNYPKHIFHAVIRIKENLSDKSFGLLRILPRANSF